MTTSESATVTKIPYTPRKHALAFHARTKKSAVVVWHRRAGKTVMCVADMIEKALRCPLEMPQYSYIAPTYKQAKKVAWKYLKKLSKPVCVKVMETDLSVELINGATITLFGADNPDSLRGLYHDGVVIDEYGDIAPSLYGQIIAPALADRDGWVVFIGTPKGPNHFYGLWKDSANDDDWMRSMLKASESGVFTPERLAKIKKQPGSDEETYNQEYECDFHAANKGAYYARQLNDLEDAGHFGLFPWDPTLPVLTGWDIGITDDTSVWFAQVHGRDIHIIDFWTGSGHSLDDVMEILASKPYQYDPFYLPHDAKNKSFQTGKSVRELMWEDHRAKSVIIPKLSVQDGITGVRATLPSVYFNTVGSEEVRKLGVPALIMYQREFDEVKGVFNPKPRHDWSSNPADAFRYLCLGINPFTAKKSTRKLHTSVEQGATSGSNVLSLENLFAERAAAAQSSRI